MCSSSKSLYVNGLYKQKQLVLCTHLKTVVQCLLWFSQHITNNMSCLIALSILLLIRHVCYFLQQAKRISRASEDGDEKHENNSTQTKATATPSGVKTEAVKPPNAVKKKSIWAKLWGNKALLVDVFSRVFFPACFIFFNIFYWGMYAVPMSEIKL